MLPEGPLNRSCGIHAPVERHGHSGERPAGALSLRLGPSGTHGSNRAICRAMHLPMVQERFIGLSKLDELSAFVIHGRFGHVYAGMRPPRTRPKHRCYPAGLWCRDTAAEDICKELLKLKHSLSSGLHQSLHRTLATVAALCVQELAMIA